MSERNDDNGSLVDRVRTIPAARTRVIAGAVFVAGVAIAFGVPHLGPGPIPGGRAVWAILGGLVAAVGLAAYDYQYTHATSDERELLIGYRATHVAFAGLLGLLSVFGILVTSNNSPIDPETALQVALAFGLLAYFGAQTYYRRTI